VQRTLVRLDPIDIPAMRLDLLELSGLFVEAISTTTHRQAVTDARKRNLATVVGRAPMCDQLMAGDPFLSARARREAKIEIA
jgi:hypothetical protein